MLKDKHHSITVQNEQYLEEYIENIVFPVSPPGLRRTMNTHVLSDDTCLRCRWV